MSDMFKIFEDLKCLSYFECLRMSGVSKMFSVFVVLKSLSI